MFGSLPRALATSFLAVGLTVGGGQSAVASIAPQADLSITKTASPDPAAPGTNLTYVIQVANAGPDAAIAATVTDVIPVGTTFVSLAWPADWTCLKPVVGGSGAISCTISTFGVGATACFTLVVNVTASDGATITNTATVGSATTDLNQGNNSATETTKVKKQADLAVTKADAPDPVVPGADLTYDIALNNFGPNGAVTVSLTDATPAHTTFLSFAQTSGPAFSCSAPAVGGTGTVNCTISMFGAGATATFTLVVRVNASTADGTTLSNTATASSSTFDPCPGNNSATTTTKVRKEADLAVTKVDAPDQVVAGTDLTYDIALDNFGPNGAVNVSLTDATPAHAKFLSFAQTSGPAFSCSAPAVGGTGTVSCTISTFGAEATATFRLVVRVNANTPNGTTLSNTVTATSGTFDPCPGNNSATTTTKVKKQADLAVTKSDAPDPVNAGENITYAIDVANAGPSDAQNVSLSDATPANTTFVSITQTAGPAFTCTSPALGGTGTVTCTIATFAAGASASFTLVVNVNANTPNGTTICNTATMSSSTTDNVPGNNSASATTTVDAVADAGADLSVTKTGPAEQGAGLDITYTITVTNPGPTDAASVVLSDAVPDNTTFMSFTQNTGPTFTCNMPTVGGTGAVDCSIASLAVDATATFTLVVNVNSDVVEGTTISNTASVSSTTSDPDQANNSSTVTTQIVVGNPT